MFIFTDVVFPWFVFADITLQIVALDTHNNVAVFFITDGSSKRAISVLSQNRTNLQFSCSFTWCVTQQITNALTWALQSVNKRLKNIQYCQLKLFQCSQRRIFFLNILCFHLLFTPCRCKNTLHVWACSWLKYLSGILHRFYRLPKCYY
jgi:hypothetical protein